MVKKEIKKVVMAKESDLNKCGEHLWSVNREDETAQCIRCNGIVPLENVEGITEEGTLPPGVTKTDVV